MIAKNCNKSKIASTLVAVDVIFLMRYMIPVQFNYWLLLFYQKNDFCGFFQKYNPNKLSQ